MQQSETFTGLLIPIAEPVLRRTQDGFIAMNDALATQCTESSSHGFDVLRRGPGAAADAAHAHAN